MRGRTRQQVGAMRRAALRRSRRRTMQVLPRTPTGSPATSGSQARGSNTATISLHGLTMQAVQMYGAKHIACMRTLSRHTSRLLSAVSFCRSCGRAMLIRGCSSLPREPSQNAQSAKPRQSYPVRSAMRYTQLNSSPQPLCGTYCSPTSTDGNHSTHRRFSRHAGGTLSKVPTRAQISHSTHAVLSHGCANQ